MKLSNVAEFLKRAHTATWHEDVQRFLEEALETRYGTRGAGQVSLRCPRLDSNKAPFAAILTKESPSSGGYGGTSFVIFPGPEGAFFSLVVGTQGLAPDEDILSRPGHARFCRALSTWVNRSDGGVSWSKQDPTRIDFPLPSEAKKLFGGWSSAIEKYGNVLYLAVKPSGEAQSVEAAFFAVLDFYMNERRAPTLAAFRQSSDDVRKHILSLILRSPLRQDVEALLTERRFVILQGPPGTGKTRLGLTLLRETYDRNGSLYQFHPSTSYEQFIGGLAPTEANGQFGFKPSPGVLMRAASEAMTSDKPYLLVLDEINRADLSRVLGEALFLFEPNERFHDREVRLPYNFGPPFEEKLRLPKNLHVLGTMNSADRSTAILDLAVRRRFAFLSLWPTREAIAASHPLAQEAFDKLMTEFLAEAADEALPFAPGHSYFIAATEVEAKARLRYELRPLLASYLQQALVPSMGAALDSYIQWLDSL